jgi:uncharacterized protein YwgA
MIIKGYQKHTRDISDSVEDSVLLLYLLSRAGKIVGKDEYYDAKVKLMKLIFLSEIDTFKNNEKGFNFFYNTYKKGPCSQEVLAILDDLQKVDLINIDYKDNSISITKKGEQTISYFLTDQDPNTKKNNKYFFDKIDRIIKEYGKIDTDKLIKIVYSLDIETTSGKKVNVGKTIEDFEKTEGKRKPCFLIRRSRYVKKFVVSREWIETFNVLCNPEFKNLVDSCYV